jgi:hypothetical protein
MARPASDFFVYQLNFLLLASGAVATQQMVFDASSDFHWLYSSYTADIAGAARSESSREYPLVSLMITPTDTSAQFMSQAVPLPSLFGNGESPFIMPVPRIIPARSAISFQATSYVAAGTTYNIYLSLIGIKKYLG